MRAISHLDLDPLRTKPEKNNEMYCMMTILGTLQIVSFQSVGISRKNHLHHHALFLDPVHGSLHIGSLERIRGFSFFGLLLGFDIGPR